MSEPTRPRRDWGDDEDDAPNGRKSGGGGTSLLILALGLTALCVIGVVGGGFGGLFMWRAAAHREAMAAREMAEAARRDAEVARERLARIEAETRRRFDDLEPPPTGRPRQPRPDLPD